MTEEAALARFPAGAGLGPKRIARKTIAVARERGVLAPDDDLEAVAPFLRYSPGIVFLILVGLIPGFVALFGFQRSCYMLVTTRHVIFTTWTLYGTTKALAETLRLDRPVPLALSEEPKKSHMFGNRVELPPQVAEFLGKDVVYAQYGDLADETFRIARAPIGAVEPQGATP